MLISVEVGLVVVMGGNSDCFSAGGGTSSSGGECACDADGGSGDDVLKLELWC